MRTAKLLVTGGAGFIGSHLVDRLLGAGAEVCVVDDFNDYYDPAKKRANVAAHLQHPRYRLVEADIRDGARMAELVALVRTRVHRAPGRARGRAPVAGRSAAVRDHQRDRARCTCSRPRATRKVPKFVFASSSSVYGLNDKVAVRRGRCAVCGRPRPTARPSSPARRCATTYSHLYGMPIVVAALLHGVRPAPAPRPGDPQVRRAHARGAGHRSSTATARPAATTPSSTTSSAACWRRSSSMRSGTRCSTSATPARSRSPSSSPRSSRCSASRRDRAPARAAG